MREGGGVKLGTIKEKEKDSGISAGVIKPQGRGTSLKKYFQFRGKPDIKLESVGDSRRRKNCYSQKRKGTR